MMDGCVLDTLLMAVGIRSIISDGPDEMRRWGRPLACLVQMRIPPWRGWGYECVSRESSVLSGRADHSSRGVPNMVSECGHEASIVKRP
jgi:hypothetical protein